MPFEYVCLIMIKILPLINVFIFVITSNSICQMKDTIVTIHSFESKYVIPRRVDIWLPAGYLNNPESRVPVIYMHDGQNLFDADLAFGGEAWGADSTIKRMVNQGLIPEMIVVGIWNTRFRFTEYMPPKPFVLLQPEMQEMLVDEYEGYPDGDDYLKFIASELKPFIDQNFRTLPGMETTLIMGSSMGGLISAYAMCEYPDVFGRAGCLSTHWIGSLEGDFDEFSDAMVIYMTQNMPAPGKHKFYFDFGSLGLDSLYRQHQAKIDTVMMSVGYTFGKDWTTKNFTRQDHNERSWRSRLNVPLLFLAGKENPDNPACK